MTITAPQFSPAVGVGRHVRLSVVMPAYNEADHIDEVVGKLLAAISDVTSSYELVVVDDGSSDATFDRLKSIASHNNRVVPMRNAINMGKGAAVKCAGSIAKGDAVVMLDADMDIAPSALKEYVETLKKFDICIASKRHPQSQYDAPLVRKFLSITFNKLVRLMTGVRFSDSQTGLKAMKGAHFKRIMAMISVRRYAYDVEILAVAQLLNLRVAELPVQIRQKSLFSARAVIYMVVDLLGIAYRLRVIRWYQSNLANPAPDYKPIIRI